MADLLPNVLAAYDRPLAAADALRRLTRELHALGAGRLAPPGLHTIYTGTAFAPEQIWSQLAMHSGKVLPHLERRLAALEQAEAEPPPLPPAPRRARPAPTVEEDPADAEPPAPRKKKKKRKETPDAAAAEAAPAAPQGKKGSRRTALGNGKAAGRGEKDAVEEEEEEEEGGDGDEAAAMDDDAEESEEEEEGTIGQAFPEGAMDPEDEELMQMLEHLESNQKAERAAKGPAARRRDDAQDADAEAALTALYGEGAFDPDEDLALHGEGEEDEEDEEDEDDGPEEGPGEEAADEAEGGRKESRQMRKLRELQESLGEGEEEEEEDDGDVFKPDTDDSAGRGAATLVDRLEAKLLRPKPWALQGEVAGNQRPTNSLLEDDFAVEHAMKQVPVITPETTQALEDRIRKRIQDKLFDDVYPKVALSTNKDVPAPPLDCVKSSLSLVDLYEKDFLEKKRLAGDGGAPAAAGTGEEGAPLTWQQQEEKHAIELWFVLSKSLDALSHAHYVPNPVLDPDLSVTASGAALKLEEAIPAAVNTAQLLAPQDTFTAPANQAGLAFKADVELTREDHRRLRRSRKADNRADRKRHDLHEYQRQMALATHKRAEERKRPAGAEGAEGEATAEGGADEGPAVLPPKHKRSKVWRIHQAKQQEAK
eukprot:EG_transcript_3775